MLDAEEYLHLAIHASSAGEHHACMTYLKEAMKQQPDNSTAIYLLAIQHAELGLFERAIRGLLAALALAPRLEVARFQLGLLLLDRARPAEAKEHLAALSGSLDIPLRIYSEALMAIADDNPLLAQEKIALGLAQESANPALSALMKRLSDKLAKRNEAAAILPGDEANARQISLGAYRNALS